MKAELLKIVNNSTSSFHSRHDNQPVYHNRWHYHPEVEILFIRAGNGRFIIGDSIADFEEGDIFILGSNLPHLFKYNEIDEQIFSDAYVLHLPLPFIQNTLWNLPEIKELKSLLDRSNRGILVKLPQSDKQTNLFERLNASIGIDRLILLIEILKKTAQNQDNKTLCSLGYAHTYDDTDSARLDNIYRFVLDNFQQSINLEEISGIANLSSNSFCRYFKSKTNKTFSNFLTEIRIGHACKLLMEKDLSISQVCYESGYNNISNFNRHFKRQVGKTPKEFSMFHKKKG